VVADRFDAVVVGAGPAGSAAALVLARQGRSVALVERGPFAGAKNMYGGVLYGRVLDDLVPRWWETAPVQRWVTRRATMVLTPTQSMTVDYRTRAWAEPPYNGATAYRADFDAWLAGLAEAAGATLICSTTVTGLLRDADGRVAGVVTDRAGGELAAPVVIAADGVNSFLAKEAGLYRPTDPSHFTLGAKEVLALPKEEIDARFALRDREGADFEILGGTGEVPGGAFLYTNLDTVAVGVVLQLSALGRSGRRPEEFIADLKVHPSIAPLVAGGELKEYSGHLIPEGGWEMVPELLCDGMMVAGDAAALCLAAGIWLEGVNFAIASGAAAGRTAAEAVAGGDTSAAGLARYRSRLESSFVLKDHRKLRRAPGFVMSDRVQRRYPAIVCDLVEELFTVRNPEPKPGGLRTARRELKKAGVRLRDLASDGWTALRTFG
jgi:electron transfer flavoprotein-quinone oxidoreductase